MMRRTRNSRRRAAERNTVIVAACCAAAIASMSSTSSPSSLHVLPMVCAEFFPKVQKSSKSYANTKSAKSAKVDDADAVSVVHDVESTTTDGVDVRDEEDPIERSSSFVPQPTRTTSCIDIVRYREIYNDVEVLADRIEDPMEQAHFYGSIVRLVAHDFMDYDATNVEDPMGSDGCIDWSSLSNAGLNSIWHEGSELYLLWRNRYNDISWADFWIMTANSVIFKTSEEDANGGKLDLVDTFLWGRDDRSSCMSSSERLPITTGCGQVEGVFLERMGLTWKDAVALMGAHTLGRGHEMFSGHHGMWMPNVDEARIFNRRYYQELMSRSWSPRVLSSQVSDFTTSDVDDPNPKMMLNTDACLAYDIENGPCCTRTDLFKSNGESHCRSMEDTQCPLYGEDNPRIEATYAVAEMLDGDDNHNFYSAFRAAWFKATTNGQPSLYPIQESC